MSVLVLQHEEQLGKDPGGEPNAEEQALQQQQQQEVPLQVECCLAPDSWKARERQSVRWSGFKLLRCNRSSCYYKQRKSGVSAESVS